MIIKRANPGDRYKPKASTFNAFADAAEAHRAPKPNGSPDGSARPWLIDVRNTGNTNLARFDAVQLGGPIISDQANPIEFDRLAGFDVSYPDDPSLPGKMAIVQEPIGPDQIGLALIFGVTPAREIIVGNEAHNRARFGAQGELITDDHGPAAILWKSPAGQSTRRAIVAITQDSPPTATATRWARIVSSAEASTRIWDYEVELVAVGVSGDWETEPDTEMIMARNTIESPNSDSGMQGDGVDADTLPNGFDLVPIGDGAVVQISGPYGEDGLWFFSVANLVDGECTPLGG